MPAGRPKTQEKLMTFARIVAAAALIAGATLPALADQPRMQEALAHLEQAREALKNASSDKGGNRQDAIRAVDKAIAEVKRGIEYDRKNLSRDEANKR
jgi:hypothetical protein